MSGLDYKRQKANESLLSGLAYMLGANPGIRFNQALYALGVVRGVDGYANFYEESWHTLAYVNHWTRGAGASRYAELDAALENADKEIDVFIDDVLRGSK